MRVKRVENGSRESKEVGILVSVVGDVDQSSKLAGEDKGKQVELSKAKQKKDSDDLKDNRNGDLDENVHLKEEDGHDGHSVATKRYSSLKKSDSAPLVVNNGDSSLQKSLRKRSRKKKDMVSDMKRTKEADPSVDTSIKISDVLHDEDEENLEENAAMMLSSRFDPSCTGFSSKQQSLSLTI
ncbi:hypothetical protein OIU78_001969 [Salix suchowensis]|nr:hypothetical protein OIU78_001969 [Salix suchowensis]